jgi:hypothetical protein
MLSLSLRAGESSILVWLIRGMWGAIFVYAGVFLLLHAVTSKTVLSTEEELPAIKKRDSAPSSTTPVEQATMELQAADSGELTKAVQHNVTE